MRNDRQENLSETSKFKSKSTWNPPKGAPALEMFLSQTEKDILLVLPGKATNYNLSKEQTSRQRVRSGSLGQNALFEGDRDANE